MWFFFSYAKWTNGALIWLNWLINQVQGWKNCNRNKCDFNTWNFKCEWGKCLIQILLVLLFLLLSLCSSLFAISLLISLHQLALLFNSLSLSLAIVFSLLFCLAIHLAHSNLVCLSPFIAHTLSLNCQSLHTAYAN